MDAVNWVQLITAILAGLATAIPLVMKLVDTVKKATKEKNWNLLLKMAMNYMTEAEKNIASGAERKEWVLAMVKASADTINYPINLEEVSKLIDSLCDMSKIVNGKK